MQAAVNKALAAGWHNVYILTSMAWARTAAHGVKRLHSYEREVNSLIKECPHFVGLCMYDRGIFSPGDLCKVLQSHPQVLSVSP